MSTTHQQDLDHIAERLSRLALDDLICIMINALAMHRGTSRHAMLNRLKVIMVTVAHGFDDVDKCLAIELMRDGADTFEHALMTMNANKALN